MFGRTAAWFHFNLSMKTGGRKHLATWRMGNTYPNTNLISNSDKLGTSCFHGQVSVSFCLAVSSSYKPFISKSGGKTNAAFFIGCICLRPLSVLELNR